MNPIKTFPRKKYPLKPRRRRLSPVLFSPRWWQFFPPKCMPPSSSYLISSRSTSTRERLHAIRQFFRFNGTPGYETLFKPQGYFPFQYPFFFLFFHLCHLSRYFQASVSFFRALVSRGYTALIDLIPFDNVTPRRKHLRRLRGPL